MKKLILFLLILGFSSAHAADVTFGWAANTDTDLAGYRLYQAEWNGSFSEAWVFVKEILPTETTTTVTVDDKNYVWKLTAFDNNGNESRASNVAARIDMVPPLIPSLFRKE